VRAFQGGDVGAFDEIHRRLWGPVFRRASRMGLAHPEAEDIAQRTLVRVYLYASRASFAGPRRLWGWVFTIATREVYKLWGRRRPDVPAGEAIDAWAAAEADAAPGPDANAATTEALADVEACLAALDASQRRAVLSVLTAGMTFRSAAAALGLRLGQFKHRYERALEAVRDCMRGKGHDVD